MDSAAGWSGAAGPSSTIHYISSQQRALIEFTSDGSISGSNMFEVQYSCVTGGSPAGLAGDIIPDVGSVVGTISSGPVRYTLSATAGITYSITVTLNTLPDSVLTIYDIDGTTSLVNNDDYGNSLASHIEWTAASTGTYFVEVSGYSPTQTGSFSLSVTSTDGQPAEDPCAGGTVLPGNSGVLNFMPGASY